MYKNQLQELAQRSCFNLPSYACIKEGPNHAPRFKACVNFNGEIFESSNYCTTLRQAEHSAAEVALNVLSTRGPSRSLTARVLDETGIYKNLLQETAHRAGLKLPVYTTVRSGPGHVPTFTCSVELAGMNFTGEPAKTKKQAEKNAAIAAWSALNKMPGLGLLSTASRVDIKEEQARKRDQNPSNRTFFRDTGSSSSSPASRPNISSRDERLKLIDLVMDSGQEGSLVKHKTFASLVPPPPPRTASKILPPPSRPIIPVQVRSSVAIPPPLEEHQKDEEEWLGGGAKQNLLPKTPTSTISVYGTSFTHKPFPLSNSISEKLTTFAESPISSGFKSVPARRDHIPMTSVCNSWQYLNPHKIAPAVQIRSVIPVCSAPPPPSKPPHTTTKEEATSSKLNHPQSTLLGSELKQQQL